jgi:hypothetical protein
MSADDVETTSDESHAADEGHGTAHELPPEPTTRSITPAREDFENPPPLGTLLWPAFWIGVGVVLIAMCLEFGWHSGLGH